MKNITKGVWTVETGVHGERYGVFVDKKLLISCYSPITEEGEANASLIAEAGTITNSTGLTPKQLAEQREELLSALKEVIRISDRKHDAWDKAKAAISKATQKPNN
jgi:hemoglobin-like flavoprotein